LALEALEIIPGSLRYDIVASSVGHHRVIGVWPFDRMLEQGELAVLNCCDNAIRDS
jgi:hypothetical protein